MPYLFRPRSILTFSHNLTRLEDAQYANNRLGWLRYVMYWEGVMTVHVDRVAVSGRSRSLPTAAEPAHELHPALQGEPALPSVWLVRISLLIFGVGHVGSRAGGMLRRLVGSGCRGVGRHR